MKITRLQVKNYRGIADLDWEVPPSGAIIKGRNAAGKSSVLKAIAAALSAQGIGPDAIRKGDDGAEILVDMDAVRIRRSITEKGSTLTVRNEEGDIWSRPQTRLTELLGTCPLDALSWFLAPAKERRRQLLEAVPVDLAFEDIDRWTNGGAAALGFAPGSVVRGAGLDALATLRETFYDERAAANKTAKETAAARRLAEAAAVHDVNTLEALSFEDALAGVTLAKLNAQELAGREAAVRRAAEATEKTSARIAALRAEARAKHNAAPGKPNSDAVDSAIAEAAHAQADVDRLRSELAEAEKGLHTANVRRDTILQEQRSYMKAVYDAEEKNRQAAELEASIAEFATLAPTEAEVLAARQDQANAQKHLDEANAAAAIRERITAAEVAKARDDAAILEAARLNTIVETLTNDAPKELAARSDMIPGLAFAGDDITLDGVSVDSLSSAEQMRFSVDVCRRLNAKAKLLVVDGLERLDEDALDTFVELATRDDWQLIATRVAKGELVVEAIER